MMSRRTRTRTRRGGSDGYEDDNNNETRGWDGYESLPDESAQQTQFTRHTAGGTRDADVVGRLVGTEVGDTAEATGSRILSCHRIDDECDVTRL